MIRKSFEKRNIFESMDAILRNTIRVTKCLLSYGVVQENVEKIILEAFADKVERYPVLYEDNVYSTDNGWTVHKIAKFVRWLSLNMHQSVPVVLIPFVVSV